ncbi:uncharacterized protein LOC116923366 [Daphnia magna]|uniref:uncharacterized protein LOC116923366 n=1 Tax=Daphnia magna TaxID=35525 RepID=UPI001E1BC3F0|nr:uncharacterized protein LOC116923366 [Daphnia magna]
MRIKCCVLFCHSTTYGKNEETLNFFSWPKDENVIELWLNAFSSNSCVTGFTKNFKLLKSLRICSLHFEKKCINEKNKKLLPNAVPTIFQLPTKATNVRGETITTPFSNVTGQSCQQLEPHRSDAQNSTVFDHPEDNHYEQDLYSNYRSSTPASNHNSGFMDEEVVSLINSARNHNVMKEVDASKTVTEMSEKVMDINDLKTTGNIKSIDPLRKMRILVKLSKTKISKFSKIPLKNNRMLVRKLRRHVNGLEKKLKDIENLIGLQVINLCKSEERMTDAVKALVNVFEEELDKHSEHNAQADVVVVRM